MTSLRAGLLFLAALALGGPNALAAAAHVQGGCNTENGGTASGTVACTLGAGVGAGDLVPLFVARHTGVTSITGVTDDKSDSCTVGSDITGATVIFTPVYCPNLTAGATTFTATLSSSATLATIIVVGEFSGLTASPLDKRTGQAQTTPGTGSNAVSSGSGGTATVPGELVVAATINQTGAAGVGTITGGTGFTAGSTEQTVTNLLRGEYLVQTSPAAVTGTFTAGSASDSFNTAVMSFMPGEQASKILGATVLNGIDERNSKTVGAAVLMGSQQANAKIVGAAVLCTPITGVLTGACPIPQALGIPGSLMLMGVGN